jgi:uncharacterized protein YecT (DUF1311 family)
MKRFALLFALLLTISSFASEERKHPIDRKIDAAADKAMSTVEMVKVQVDGLKLWDVEMNRVYGELKKRLKPSAFTALQAAQRAWIAYRDTQLKFLGEFYSQFQGTMYRPMEAAAELEVTRQRALELTEKLETLKDEQG